MVGEGNMIQIIMVIVHVESTIATIAGLHPSYPDTGTLNGCAEFLFFRLHQGMGDHGRIVHVWIPTVAELESPSAASKLGALYLPVARLVGQLLARQPTQAVPDLLTGLRALLVFVHFLQSQGD